jgi:hypothetical protein
LKRLNEKLSDLCEKRFYGFRTEASLKEPQKSLIGLFFVAEVAGFFLRETNNLFKVGGKSRKVRATSGFGPHDLSLTGNFRKSSDEVRRKLFNGFGFLEVDLELGYFGGGESTLRGVEGFPNQR